MLHNILEHQKEFYNKEWNSEIAPELADAENDVLKLGTMDEGKRKRDSVGQIVLLTKRGC